MNNAERNPIDVSPEAQAPIEREVGASIEDLERRADVEIDQLRKEADAIAKDRRTLTSGLSSFVLKGAFLATKFRLIDAAALRIVESANDAVEKALVDEAERIIADPASSPHEVGSAVELVALRRPERLAGTNASKDVVTESLARIVHAHPEKFASVFPRLDLRVSDVLALCFSLRDKPTPLSVTEAILRNQVHGRPEDFAVMSQSLRPDTKLLLDLFRGVSPEKRKDLEAWMGIRMPAEEFVEAHETVADLERREIAGLIGRSERVSRFVERQLDDGIVRAQEMGDATRVAELTEQRRRELERRADEHALFSGVISGVVSLGDGLNSAMAVRMKGRQLPSVYKARKYEQGLREGVEAGTYAKREWLAGQIDRMLRLNVVPPTVVRSGPEGIGSIQDWRIGELGKRTPWTSWMDANDKEAIAVFDEITQNTDRHQGNLMLTPDRHGVAIDNGLIFSELPGALSFAVDAMDKKTPSDKARGKLNEFLSDETARAELLACFELALGPEASKHFEKFLARTKALADGTPFKTNIAW